MPSGKVGEVSDTYVLRYYGEEDTALELTAGCRACHHEWTLQGIPYCRRGVELDGCPLCGSAEIILLSLEYEKEDHP